MPCQKACAGTSSCHSNPTTSIPEAKNKYKHAANIGFEVLEKVCLVALTAFAIYTSWQLFVPFFLIGAVVGAVAQNEMLQRACNKASSCSSGLMEQLTGIKLPATVMLIVNVAVTMCHIDHHKEVFVPLTAFSVGLMAGKESVVAGKELYKSAKEIYRASRENRRGFASART